MLDDYEAEARTRDVTLGALGKLPEQFIQNRLTTTESREHRRLKTALLLADSSDTFIALARQGKAPRPWVNKRLRELGYR